MYAAKGPEQADMYAYRGEHPAETLRKLEAMSCLKNNSLDTEHVAYTRGQIVPSVAATHDALATACRPRGPRVVAVCI